jgi:dGTPase
MEWSKLFSKNRLTDHYSGKMTEKRSDRNDFQRDFDRIIFCSAFQRLYGKTQVVPIPYSPSIRTRLTHSLETASVGRSLGRLAGIKIVPQYQTEFDEINITADDFGSVVSAACLAHDIGNPPLGHSGEEAISQFFKSGGKLYFTKELNDKQKADFTNFEGNALGFRLLTHTLPAQSQRQGGLGLTYATLAAFTKYPKESLPKKPSANVSDKKFGFFQADKEKFHIIAEEIGLRRKSYKEPFQDNLAWSRHPLAFLVEAADDICNCIRDVEDGHKLKWISFETAKSLLMEIVGTVFDDGTYKQILDEDEKIGYLRALSINVLVRQAANLFMDKQRLILAGSFEKSICDSIPAKNIMDEIGQISAKDMYHSRSVLETEAAGFEVLPGLLDIFLKAALSKEKTKQADVVLGLIPAQYFNPEGRIFDDVYERILYITQYIACMTDTFAIDTYRLFKGIALPNY